MQKGFLKYSYLLLVLPIFIFLLAIKSNIESNFTPERVLYSYLVFYLAAIFISNRKLKFYYITFIYSFSIILTYLELCYAILYHERVTTSTIFVLMETNGIESTEYLKEYLNYKIILGFVLVIIYSFFILKGVKILNERYTRKEIFLAIKQDVISLFNNSLTSKINQFFQIIRSNNLGKFISGIILFLCVVFIYINKNHYRQHVLYQAYDGFQKYKQEQLKYNNFKFQNTKQVNFTQLQSNSKDEKETLVLVIGESTTRTHLQLYNYYRETNPKLSEIKNELVVFNNVISPHTHTIPCLEKMLTRSNYEDYEKKYEGTIIDIMKQVGFKTFWISNQIPVGIYETRITSIAKSSDKIHFTNLGGEREQQSLDEKILPYLARTLEDTSKKKFIVVHLLGTHGQYINRYPKKFDKFTDTPMTIFNSDDNFNTINYYDNAVLYNDYIVSEIIHQVEKENSNKKASIIYLSDHGEDVFETVDMGGHSEAIASKPMYLIPFIFWSNNQAQIEKLQQYKDRKYMSDDLFYSIVDIANITFNDNQPERSIFSENFKERKRIVKNGKDFDELYH